MEYHFIYWVFILNTVSGERSHVKGINKGVINVFLCKRSLEYLKGKLKYQTVIRIIKGHKIIGQLKIQTAKLTLK